MKMKACEDANEAIYAAHQKGVSCEIKNISFNSDMLI